jgi:carboxyl-terminal processing protease
MGPKGSSVEVTVERTGWTRPKPYTLIRDEIHVKSVPYAFMLNNGIGYIGIIRFSSTTGRELEDALRKLEGLGMKQLILDLRFNTGGYLESAVDVVDRFLPGEKMIVYTKGRIQGSYREFFSTERNTHPIQPVIVLINRISASASEIVAGALQDWDRALVLGETSFGKGLVQSQYRFSDGSALLMTTARYYTPSGRLIQRSYSDKSSEEYYSEIADDSLREQNNQDRSRPAFKTKILNREVYGGGGITPDVFLTAKQDTFSPKIRELVFSSERPLYTFAEDYLKLHPEIKKDFNDFLWNFRLDPSALQRFLTTVRNLGLSLSSTDMIWGDEARQKITLLRDRQLQESLSYFARAEGLLTQAYLSHTKQG